MDPITLAKINDLNRLFYAQFGGEFSKTRGRIQPGVASLLAQVNPNWSILDVGCGNGTFAIALAEKGFSGHYTGLDFSQPLLTSANSATPAPGFQFIEADLTNAWPDLIFGQTYDLAVSFAVIHHIAGIEQRDHFFQNIYRALKPGGTFFISTWQFTNSEKLANRIVDWSVAGIQSNDVDQNDYLLDWKSGGIGLRYVHLFSDEDLRIAANQYGFEVETSFLSDGSTGNLGLYQVWKKS